MTVFTIGHSNLELDRLLALLREHRVDLVADVRSAPYSRYAPQFNREPLAAAVERAGIQYLYFGREMGGKREPPVLLEWIARTPEFGQGLKRLVGPAG